MPAAAVSFFSYTLYFVKYMPNRNFRALSATNPLSIPDRWSEMKSAAARIPVTAGAFDTPFHRIGNIRYKMRITPVNHSPTQAKLLQHKPTDCANISIPKTVYRIEEDGTNA